MHSNPIVAILLFYALGASAFVSGAPQPQHIFTNPPTLQNRIPTVYESAVQARRILVLANIATLSTVFPSSSCSEGSSGPDEGSSGVAGAPIGLIDYYASCGPNWHDPTFLAITIATTFRNARAGSNVTLSLRYHPPRDHAQSRDPFTYAPSNLPRFSLMGYVQRMSREEVRESGVVECFLKSHPEARMWMPGNEIHESWWARLVVEKVYWIGGFGDRAYIGWIPVEVYRAVTVEEVDKARLVGEEGWVEER